jgi:hypothetical protein
MTTLSRDEAATPEHKQIGKRDTSALRLAALVLIAVTIPLTIWLWRRPTAPPLAADATTALPDWSGLWTVERDPKHPWGVGDPVWTPDAAKQIEALQAEEKAGNPRNVYIDCLPEGMPSFVMMTVAALEFLFTPGRVTILGEFDGNRLRRIYTDGRPHPSDPDLTFNGHSVGHWEGDTLVVDTVGLLPQNYLPLGQAVALPNNGDMHIEERIHPLSKDRLRFELVVHAPHMLHEPWQITRTFVRQANRKLEIVEASCRQGDFTSGRDAHGNHIWVPIAHDPGGAPLPTGH